MMFPPEQVPGIPGAVFQRVERLHLPPVEGGFAGPWSSAGEGQLVCSAPQIGTFLVRDGTIVEFDLVEGADLGWVKLILQGTARGALIHQRGELPLHAAALVPPGGTAALAICGASGAGKSTLARELVRRGWALLADDTTRISGEDGGVIAWQSSPQIKLWRDACDAAGIPVTGLEQVTRDLDKFYLPVRSHEAPARLTTIIELVDGDSPARLSPGGKVALLTRNTYRPAQIRPLGMQAAHVRIAARVASACTILQLPGRARMLVATLADAAEAALRPVQ
jgi:hypothetical protein